MAKQAEGGGADGAEQPAKSCMTASSQRERRCGFRRRLSLSVRIGDKFAVARVIGHRHPDPVQEFWQHVEARSEVGGRRSEIRGQRSEAEIRGRDQWSAEIL